MAIRRGFCYNERHWAHCVVRCAAVKREFMTNPSGARGSALRGAAAAAVLAPAAMAMTGSPWGMASGAEDSGKYPQFVPMLRDAGVTWIRYFQEWAPIQPAKGEWRWDWSDNFVKFNKEHGIEVTGIFLYFARWASSDGGTRGFPVKDINDWSAYVAACVERFKEVITWWEVWNEGNSPAFNRHGSPKDYADLVRAAYTAGKAANPDAKFGITCAAFDLHYFDQAIKAGAAGHFDYVCVHPYNSIGYVFGSEHYYMAMAQSVRNMLAANGQDATMPIWMTETGLGSTDTPEQERAQANALVRTYILNIAQGIEKTFWFEAVGPKYGEGTHAIIRDDFTPRPAYDALKKMTAELGPTPRYLGWMRDGDNLGFVFDNNGETVLVSWNVTANPSSPEAAAVYTRNAEIAPTLINAPGTPLGRSYADVDEVWIKLGQVNEEFGIRQGNNNPRTDGNVIIGDGWRQTDLLNRRPFIYCDIDPTFADFNDARFEITVTARRAKPDVPTVCTLVYESKTGYHEYGKRITTPGLNVEMLFECEDWRAPELWYIPPGGEWHTRTWKINDACFIGKWGWRFQINAEMSAGDVQVQEIRIKKIK